MARRKTKVYDMPGRVHKLVKRFDYNPSDNILVFIDTGAVIDCEGEAKRWKLADPDGNVKRVYDILSKYKNITPLVTREVLDEVIRHHEGHMINGKPEISTENYRIIGKELRNYENLLRTVAGYDKDPEEIRGDTYWAMSLAFDRKHKKAYRDPYSNVDRELIYSAVLAKHSQFMFSGKNGLEMRTPDNVVILSPDEHIHAAVALLTDRNLHSIEKHGRFNYDGIKAVTSRETP